MLETVNDYINANLTHSIHTTELRSFWGCRRRHNWVFRQYYYPTITPKPLEFGVDFHKAMEVLYSPDLWPDWETSGALALVTFRDAVAARRKEYEENYGSLTEEQEQDYKERLALGLGMIRHYVTKIMPQYDKDFTPIYVEIKFEVPIEGPNGEAIWCKCDICWRRYIAWYRTKGDDDLLYVMGVDSRTRANWKGLPVSYGGRIDCLARDQYGRYWIVDWKTARALTATGDDDYLWVDAQITSYCWALRKKLNLDIAGFVYAEIKKAYPIEPEPLTRTYKGRWYSTNKQQPYDFDTYKKTVSENDPVAFEDGLYDDFLHFLETEVTYHHRHQIDRTETELENAGYNIWLVAQEITDPNLRIYPSPGRFSCQTCAFQSPCLSMQRGDDFQYELDTMFDKRRYHYYEDKEPSTESKGGE